MLGALATIAVIAFDLWSLQNDVMVAYGDSASHLAIARRVVDNITPGFGQLGSSWLPALHLLMLPFIWNDTLWHTGLAGAIVGNIAYVGSVIYGYRLLRLMLQNKNVAFISSVVVFANPNLLYMATTTMNESLFVFSTLASTVHLILWVRQPQQAYHLIWAAAFSFLTAFNRYEGWFFVIGQAVILFFVAWRLRGRKWSLGTSLLFAHLAFSAPALWLGWNWLIFGDPLFFLHNDYTSQGSQLSLEQAGLLPTKGNIMLSCEYFFRAMVHVLGLLPSLLVLVAVALTLLALPFFLRFKIVKNDFASQALLIGALTIPGLFLIYTLVQGVTALHIPDAPPFSEYNIRYALFVFPALVGFIALLITVLHRIWKPLAWGLIMVFALGVIPVWQPPWITVVEGQGNQENNDRRSKGIAFLKSHYEGGKILINAASRTTEGSVLISVGTGAGNPFIHRLGLPMRNFIYEGNQDIWERAINNPARYVEWIVISNAGKAEHSRDKVAQYLLSDPDRLVPYDLVYKDGPLEIYHLRAIEVRNIE